MAAWPPITRDDLRRASGDAGFDTVFPLLIRRMIAETGAGVRELDMPGGSGTAAGGFDGVVSAGAETTFVPADTSVWELSVGGGQAKADDDYTKRTEAPNNLSTREVTYVEVILAPWIKSRTWSEQRTKERRWKAVRGYNLDRVHAWLDLAPATTAWLAEQLGKAMPGVQAAETWWADTWLPSTTVPLDPGVVLAGRDSAAVELLRRLSAGDQVISLGGDLRPDEARAFVAAALETSQTPAGSSLRARTLLVSDPGSLNQLTRQPQPLVLVLTDAQLANAVPGRHAHQVILLASPGSSGDVPVPPIDGQAVAAQLRTLGRTREQADTLGVLARRSLLALRRAVAVAPVMLTPSWAIAPDVIRRRLLLLGAWDGQNTEDRDVVARCVGRPYAEVQEAALALAAAPEMPFLAQIDERWHLLSPEDAWTLLRPSLTRDDLESLRAAVEEVLGERDPVLDLDEDERWKARLTGVSRKYSGTLREALAQTLALLGSDAAGHAPGNATGSQWARLLVRQLLDKANSDDTYDMWSSLTDVLPLLAEAAPDAFLDAMTEGLSGDSPLHIQMFRDSGHNALGSPKSSPHVAFLWALEEVAWSPEYFDDAVDILVQLAVLDPGGTWSNRPAASVTGILCCWRPNTTAGVAERIRAIERLYRNEAGVGRQVLLDLIPDRRGFQRSHDGPRFRSWKDERPVSHADMHAVASRAVEILLADLDEEPGRYLALIEKLDDLSAQHRAIFAQHLTVFGGTLTSDEDRARIFDAVREMVARHREYADAAWALPEDELRALESAAVEVQPRDLVRRHTWLFAADWITLGDQRRRDDYVAYEAAVSARRNEALQHILAEDGLAGVAALADRTNYPHLVGLALAAASSDIDADMLAWLEEDQAPRREVAFSYIAERLRQAGLTLRAELLVRTRDARTQARVLRATFDPPTAWADLAELPEEVSENYWREFRYTGLGASFAYVVEAARGLMGVGRHAAALGRIALYRRHNASAEAALTAVEAFEALLAGGLDDPEWPGLQGHDFEQLFDLLARHRNAVGLQRIVHIEWQLFPALGFRSDAPTLHAALAEEPAFFAELLSATFWRDGQDADESRDEDEEERRRAVGLRAYEVLHTWQRCPGVRLDGTLDEQRLHEWITVARDLLRSADLLGRGDEQIGEVLAFAPADPDGLFHPKAVRDLLEEVRSTELETGLRIGIRNQRGGTSRGLFDGGRQEWELVKSYQEHSEASAEWPRTRKLLSGMAESYEQQARAEDARAEHRRRGLPEGR